MFKYMLEFYSIYSSVLDNILNYPFEQKRDSE